MRNFKIYVHKLLCKLVNSYSEKFLGKEFVSHTFLMDKKSGERVVFYYGENQSTICASYIVSFRDLVKYSDFPLENRAYMANILERETASINRSIQREMMELNQEELPRDFELEVIEDN